MNGHHTKNPFFWWVCNNFIPYKLDITMKLVTRLRATHLTERKNTSSSKYTSVAYMSHPEFGNPSCEGISQANPI